jgi:manganese/zinc/iron transport system substrate-binding protein
MPNFRAPPLLIWISLALLLSACGRASPQQISSERPIRAVVTVGMVADMVANIGGERVTVTALMGPGVDPHLYKPSLGDVRALDQADVIFFSGLHLEGRMVELFEKMNASGYRAIEVSDQIDRALLHELAELEGSYDPHIWFDVTLWQRTADRVEAALIALDPASQALYQRNADAYQTRLTALHAYVERQAASIPTQSRVLITAHDAFGYFGARYGFEVRGIQGTSTATEASASDVRVLAQFIADRKIKAIFVESSVPAATVQAVQAAVRARGWDVAVGGELFADAMGAAGTTEGTYEGMVRHNIDTITDALR